MSPPLARVELEARSFLYEHTDVPEGQTLGEWRADRERAREAVPATTPRRRLAERLGLVR